MTDTGRNSRETGSEGIRALWETAEKLNVERGTERGEYVPWRTIHIDDAVLPRERIDADAVERYAEDFAHLPPITVQRDTFTLIGGRTRLEAAPKVGSDFVRIEEVDAADKDLWRLAFEDNRRHGVPMTMRERVIAAKRALKEHGDDTTEPWSDGKIAEWAGVSRQAVWSWRPKNNAALPPPQVVNALQPEGEIAVIPQQPRARIGRDDKPQSTVGHHSRNGVHTNGTDGAVPKPAARTVLFFSTPIPRPPEEAPRLYADEVPSGDIQYQINQARQASADIEDFQSWLDEYAEALEDRLMAIEEVER